ncbi:heptaprenyl diphosphate synthase component 1 [Ornithinibacillus halotolerans]|nr:heptaprenyl diphosphate synthase component 1 [Ornithinibacillus halotolerans]
MERELQRLNIEIEKKIHHSFLLQHINKPKIDEYKLYFLIYIVNKSSLPQHVKDQLIITTMLVQVALDIHEEIPDDNGDSIDVKNQLSILAGDYYSGLYYSMLAEIEERSLISLLASAIKQINELKMKNYYLQSDSVEMYWSLKKQITSRLIQSIAEHFHLIDEIPVMSEILLTCDMINHINSDPVDRDVIIDKQVTKTKGMIDELPTDWEFKQDAEQILHRIVYQHTSSEMD